MDAIVAGHVCIDLTPDLGGHQPIAAVGEMIRPGSLVDVSHLTVSPGGAVANTGLGLARMGFSVGLIARVGRDPLAVMVREELTRLGGARAHIELIEDPVRGTSYSVILAMPGLDRVFLHDSGANDAFTRADIDEGFARLDLAEMHGGGQQAPPRLMHFAYPTAIASMYADGPGPLKAVLQAARERGMTVSVDFSLPDPAGAAAAAEWRDILADALSLTDICFPSVEELSLMLDPAGFHERERSAAGAEAFSPDYANHLAGELIALGAAVVVVKLGSRGLLVRWGSPERLAATGALQLAPRVPTIAGTEGTAPINAGGTVVIPAWPAPQVVAATGAGDTTIAGVLAALLSDEPLLVALEMGCLAGRSAVMTVDAVSSTRPYGTLAAEHRSYVATARRTPVAFEDATAWHESGGHYWFTSRENERSIS